MADITSPRRSLIAVDTNVLMDMADGNDATLEAIASCVKRPQLALVVTPTVIQELSFGAENWEPEKRQDLAQKALGSILGWGIKPIDLIPTGHGICELLAQCLLEKGFLPPAEHNDALILAEAALCDASILLTWDPHLTSIPHDRLTVLFGEKHVSKFLITSPSSITRLFGKR